MIYTSDPSLLSVLPNLNLELATTNYLGGSLDCNLIAKDVELLLYKPLYPQNFSKLSLNSVDVYYGVDILEFLAIEVKELELLTDVIPHNRRTLSLFDRCIVM